MVITMAKLCMAHASTHGARMAHANRLGQLIYCLCPFLTFAKDFLQMLHISKKVVLQNQSRSHYFVDLCLYIKCHIMCLLQINL